MKKLARAMATKCCKPLLVVALAAPLALFAAVHPAYADTVLFSETFTDVDGTTWVDHNSLYSHFYTRDGYIQNNQGVIGQGDNIHLTPFADGCIAVDVSLPMSFGVFLGLRDADGNSSPVYSYLFGNGEFGIQAFNEGGGIATLTLPAEGSVNFRLCTVGTVATGYLDNALVGTLGLTPGDPVSGIPSVFGERTVIDNLVVTGTAPMTQTTTLFATADTYVRSGQDNTNTGGGQFMRVQQSGNNRALVRFDQVALQAAVGAGAVQSAKLRLTIVDNGNNWGATGRTVDVHRLLSGWTEGNGTESTRGTGPGVTWNCATDSLIENQAKNCSGSAEWQMGQPNNPAVHPWAQTPTATQTVTNGETGVVEYDVTADVASFVSGASANYGWIVKKTNEGAAGQVDFSTREGVSAAQLVVTYVQ